MGRKSTKGKERRQQRKEENARLYASQAIVDKANKQEDPLAPFSVFRRYEKNGLSVSLECKLCGTLDSETITWIFGLEKRNMQTLYEQCEWGWNDKVKKEEMTDDRAWYLIARKPDTKPVAFSHFRFDMDMETIVLFLTASCLQTALGAGVVPQNRPNYTESFIPPAAQVIYHVIEQSEYSFSSTEGQLKVDGKRPFELSTITLLEESRDQKEVTPPQKELLHLHNLLIRESKLQGLGKFQGYSDEVLAVLRRTSDMTAIEQLKVVLTEALQRKDIKRTDTKEDAEKVLKDLEDADSELHKMMKDFLPLQYT